MDFSSRFLNTIPQEKREEPVQVLFAIEMAYWYFIDYFPEDSAPKEITLKSFSLRSEEKTVFFSFFSNFSFSFRLFLSVSLLSVFTTLRAAFRKSLLDLEILQKFCSDLRRCFDRSEPGKNSSRSRFFETRTLEFPQRKTSGKRGAGRMRHS